MAWGAASASRTEEMVYRRHEPEATPLYRIVERYWPELESLLASREQQLPKYVREEFEGYLRCGRLEHGFLRVACEDCRDEKLVAFSCKGRGFCPSCGAKRMVEGAALLVDEILPADPVRQWVISFPFQLRILFARHPEWLTQVLGIVWRVLSGHLIRKAGQTRKTARTGSVTLIQRFGSALNLNIHLHMLILDGVYAENGHGKLRFQRVRGPTGHEIRELLATIARRVGTLLEKRGVLERDEDTAWLILDAEAGEGDPLLQWAGSSVHYRIAEGPNRGRKVFTLQTLPAREEKSESEQLAKFSGFSLHAGVVAEGYEQTKREHLCRYITRPPLSEKRLSIAPNGQICYLLKNPYRDGTTRVLFDPLDFLSRLAALIPRPGVNLTRFARIIPDTRPLRGPAKAVQIHSR
jgi:ribosomal protein S27E